MSEIILLKLIMKISQKTIGTYAKTNYDRQDILLAYRQLVKLLNKFKQIEPKIHEHFSSVLHQIVKNNTINRQEFAQSGINVSTPTFDNPKSTVKFIHSLSALFEHAHQRNKKSMTKILRIYTNSSKYITPTLVFQPDYQIQELTSLDKDTEYTALGTEDRLFVREVISRVCGRKPKLKYRDVATYLASNSSESGQPQFDIKTVPLPIASYFRHHHEGAYGSLFRKIFINEADKLEETVEQIYLNGIVII